MMKRITLGLLLLLSLLGRGWAQGYDFSAATSAGQTLYYKYVDGGVQLVHPSTKNAYAQAWDGYTKPTGALTVPAYVSDGDTVLSVVGIGTAALAHCYNLTSIFLADGITQLGDYALTYCTMLSEVHLPASLVSMGNQAMANLGELTDVWVLSIEPPATHTYSFHNTTLSNCTLHVDCASATAYHEAEHWKDFGQFDTSVCTARLRILAGNAAWGGTSGSGSYDMGTLVVATATAYEGYRFACWHDGDTTNPRLLLVQSDSLLYAVFRPMAEEKDTVYVAVPTSDTVYVGVPVHDTITDTVLVSFAVYDTIQLTDTLYVAVPTGDTVVMPIFVHDTLLHTDTLFIPLPTYDTLTMYDTIVLTQHDTVMPTFFHLRILSDNPTLGVGVGSALLPAGVEAEVCALPLEGGRFVGWSDGLTDNPRRLTVMGETTLTAQFETLGIEELAAASYSISTHGLDILVENASSQALRLYDTAGHLIATHLNTAPRVLIRVPSAGVYLLQVGNAAARKVIVN